MASNLQEIFYTLASSAVIFSEVIFCSVDHQQFMGQNSNQKFFY